MAGYSRIYCVGDEGGYLGSDGINSIHFQILCGEGNRQWLKVHYFDKRIRPMGGLEVIVPAGPDHPDSLIDACLAFYPEHFRSCTSLSQVERAVEGMQSIEFESGEPDGWAQLRAEARPLFRQLKIYEAELRKLEQ
ncbi:MAG: hypothetical protein OXI70_11135 [Chloroflexota bacterium]|nr:hypothetical protein [Chloroflexota bacterium]